MYTEEQGKRIFAVLGIGSSVGAVVGSRIAHGLVSFGPPTLMVGATLLLVVCVGLIALAEARTCVAHPGGSASADAPIGPDSAARLLIRHRFLLLLAVLTLALNCVNANGEYLLDHMLLRALSQADYFG